MSPRTGRPTNNPKDKLIAVRLDEEAKEILNAYCKQENVEKSEAARRGIKKLRIELKKRSNRHTLVGRNGYSKLHTPKGVCKIIVSPFGVVVKRRKEIFMQELQVIEIKGQRVILTKQLAEAYGTERQIISNNYTRNRKRYTEGKHVIVLEGEHLREFKAGHQIDDNLKYAHTLYLWTEKGALLHAKSLNTEKAWEVYDYLVDFYFRAKEETQETAKGQQAAEKNAVVPVKTRTERIPEGIETKAGTTPLYNSMDAGKVFENLIHLAASEGLMVKFAPLRANYARIKGDRIALNSSLETIEDFNYNLAQSLAHYFLHYDKGDITEGSRYKEYEEQADRGAKMLMTAMTAK